MTRLVEFPLESGSTVMVEVEEARSGGVVTRGLGPAEIATKATQTFEDALEKMRPAAGAVIAKLRDLSVPPDQVGVEFGIKLNADAKAYIASASAEANFKVTLTWKRREP
ncbi:MAG TPA: CU044_2847 family protein [Pyrinomonadaceae bacterium]|nr:CU044_2847 family protein [Pyrinomonadaceae bacterium]